MHGPQARSVARGHVQGVHEPRPDPDPRPAPRRRKVRGGADQASRPGPADRVQAPHRDAGPGRPPLPTGGCDGVLPPREPEGHPAVRPHPRGPRGEPAERGPAGAGGTLDDDGTYDWRTDAPEPRGMAPP